MINPETVKAVDQLLDEGCSQIYKDEPLAQDWARLAKIAEELSEALAEADSKLSERDFNRLSKISLALGRAVNEFILSTGQNPRKGMDENAFDRFLSEVADTALSAIYCLQHFTKDIDVTEFVLRKRANIHNERLEAAKLKTPEKKP